MIPDLSSIIAIDTETGGLDPARDALLSIGACTITGQRFQRYIWPHRQWWRLGQRCLVHPRAAEVNGYHPETWENYGAVELREAMCDFADWLSERKKEGARVALAHNAGHDRSFLVQAERRTSIDLHLCHRWECSLAVFRWEMRCGTVPRGPASLDALCDLAGIHRPPLHETLADADSCLEGYRWLLCHSIHRQLGDLKNTATPTEPLTRAELDQASREIRATLKPKKKKEDTHA